MEVRLAKTAGFCFGVKRAVETVYEQVKECHGEKIYTYGPIIHNEEVVKDLRSKGVEVIHTEDEVEEELNIIIDLGGIVKDVFVYHKAYGVVRADMNIRFRKDVKTFVDNIKSGKSSLLMNVTSGYHYHTILAENEETLDMIFDALSEGGFLAALQDYEPVDFWKTEA